LGAVSMLGSAYCDALFKSQSSDLRSRPVLVRTNFFTAPGSPEKYTLIYFRPRASKPLIRLPDS
jgi:hypothetical protein